MAILLGTLLVPDSAQALPPGWLDTTYSPGNFGVTLDSPPNGGAVDSAGRALTIHENTLARLTVDGGQDPTFGTGGDVALPLWPLAMLVGSDGIYVAGQPASGNGVVMARVTADGVVDTSYGSGGLATVGIPATINDVRDLTQLASGDVMVAALHSENHGLSTQYYLAAVTPSGALDPAWNATGPTPGARALADSVVSISHAGNVTAVTAAAKIGSAWVTRVRQYAANGAADVNFGSSGVLTLPASLDVRGVDVGSDGKYYLSGLSGTGPSARLIVMRLLPASGKPDNTFGVSGIARVATAGPDTGALTVTAGGFVYVFTYGAAIVRLTSAGAVDLSYGTGGVLSGFPNPPGMIGFGFVSGGVQPSGKAVVVGRTSDMAGDGFQTPVAYRVNASVPSTAGAFVPLSPSRVLDTRTGLGAAKAAVGPGRSVSLQVGAGAEAVVMTVTAVTPTRGGFVTVYPSGTSRPTVSNLNHPAGATTPNLVSVPVGADGKVVLYNGSAGTTHLLADLVGYYRLGTPSVPGAFESLAPARILDTRTGTGAPQQQVPAGGTLTLTVAGSGGVPGTGVSAIVLNATVVGQTKPGYLTIFPTGSSRPTASNLNFYPGSPRANLASVRLGSGGALSLYNASTAPVDLVADIAGYYLDGTPTAPGTFVAVDPTRILDTRTPSPHPIAAHGTLVVPAPSIPAHAAMVLNATATRATQPGFATFHGGTTKGPFDTSTLNFVAGQTTASLTVTAGNGFVVYNGSLGTIHAVADLAGYFLP